MKPFQIGSYIVEQAITRNCFFPGRIELRRFKTTCQGPDELISSRLAVNRGSRLDFTPRPTLFFLPAGFCCLVSSIEETPSARLSKLENYGFDQLVSQRD